MNLFDAKHVDAEEINRFEGDLRAFLMMLQEHYEEEQLKTAIAMHRKPWYAVSKELFRNRQVKMHRLFLNSS